MLQASGPTTRNAAPLFGSGSGADDCVDDAPLAQAMPGLTTRQSLACYLIPIVAHYPSAVNIRVHSRLEPSPPLPNHPCPASCHRAIVQAKPPPHPIVKPCDDSGRDGPPGRLYAWPTTPSLRPSVCIALSGNRNRWHPPVHPLPTGLSCTRAPQIRGTPPHPAAPCSRARVHAKSEGHPITQPHRAVVHACTPNQGDTPSPNPIVQSCTRARQIRGTPPHPTPPCSRARVHTKSGGPPITPPHRAVVHACTPK